MTVSAFVLASAAAMIQVAGAQIAPLPVDTTHATAARPMRARFIVAPYGWMTGISGETGVGDLSANVDISFSELLSHLKFGAMGSFEAGYGHWLGVLDGIYASVGADRQLSRGRVQPELDLTTKMLIAQAFAGYSVSPGPGIMVDILAGARLWAVDASLAVSTDVANRTRSRSPTWADALGGARVRWVVSPKWQVSLAGDGGAGGSKGTGEGIATAAYDVSRYWSLFASYRYLYEHYEKGDYFFIGHMAGPAIGGAYHW